MLEYQQSESIAERRRWMLHLVDATDGITPETGVTGQGKISKNGGEPDDTTNSLVEVDSTEMPGFYYIELTASELDTLGFIGLRFKTAATAEFQDRALVTYNDPFARHGGMGGGSSKGLTAKQADDIAERVWKVKLREDKTAKEVLLSKSDFNPETDKVLVDIPSYEESFGRISKMVEDLSSKDNGVESILTAISNIKQADYTKSFADVLEKVDRLGVQVAGILPEVSEFGKSVKEFQSKMGVASENINSSLDKVQELHAGFEDLQELVNDFKDSLGEQTDMDKRFAAMKAVMDKSEITNIAKQIKELQTDLAEELRQLALTVREQKFHIIDELKK